MSSTKQPELLAPAGNWDCVRAALANGADAIYFGLEQFNARMRADNFKLEDLPTLMGYLHSHGARGYVTMNILIFPRELDEACRYLQALDDAKVDAVIIQDMGMAAFTAEQKQRGTWNFELHLSTQMTLSAPEAVRLVDEQFRPDQIVLARELSLSDIAACAAATDAPIEVFCHGALCVAYSGQCLTSESLGQRSANRGECAQACRMPYTLEVDGRLRDMGERRYLFSPQDLCALERIPEMLEAGVRSFKIEGRLKSPSYVAATTRAYRHALDKAMGKSQQSTEQALAQKQQDLYAMQMAFSRGFYTGWLDGSNHPALTHGRFGKKRGALAGRIARVGYSAIELEQHADIPIAKGDGFVLDAGEDRNEEQGGRIWKTEEDGLQLFFHGKASNIDWDRVDIGQLVWKTSDPALDKQLQQSWSSFPRPKTSQSTQGNALDIHLSGMIGSPLTLSCRGITLRSQQPLQEAQRQPLTPETIEKQLSRLGDTPYSLGTCSYSIPHNAMLPVSQLNTLRRELIARLAKEPASQPTQQTASEPRTRATPRPQLPAPTAPLRGELPPYQLHVLCRTEEQACALASQRGIARLYLDLPSIKETRDALAKVREINPTLPLWLASLRIYKPKEQGMLRKLMQSGASGVLARSLAAIAPLKAAGIPIAGDFSLNCANGLSAAYWQRMGLHSCAISYDLNAEQVDELLRQSDASFMELTIHQHMPLFHMEHCVYCTFLSQGINYIDCGRPCDYHQVRVKDRADMLHHLRSDEGCRNTLYHEQAQTAALHLHNLRRRGLRQLRIEFLDETPQEATRIVDLYDKILANEGRADHLIRQLRAFSRLGLCKDILKTP